MASEGKRAEVVREYLGHIDQLQPGQAGRLEAIEGESIAAVKRRLGQVARLADKSLVIKRIGEEIYFWTGEGRRPRRSRSRSD